MAGAKTKSASRKKTSARRSASKKTEAAPAVKDTDLDRDQHVHTERADAMLPGAPASVVPVGVDELKLQDALSKQTK